MLIFVIVFVLCFVAEIVRRSIPNKVVNFICIAVIVLLASIMPAIRDVSIGTDTDMYVNFFATDWTYFEWWVLAGIEPGLASCVKLFQFFGVKEYFYFLLFFSIIYNALIISTIYKISSGKYLSLVIFLTSSGLYLAHFNILRQSMALALFVFSLRYLLAGKFVKTYGVLLVAVFFHFSAILLLAIPVIYKRIKKNPYFIIFMTLTFMVLYSNASLFLSYAGNATGTEKYAAYNKSNNFGGGYFLYCALMFIISIYFLINTNLRTDRNYRFFCYLVFVSFFTWVCMLVFGLKYEGPGRIVTYFYVGMIFIIPEWLKVIERRGITLMYFAIVIVCFVVFFYFFFLNGLHAVFPYKINPFLVKII